MSKRVVLVAGGLGTGLKELYGMLSGLGYETIDADAVAHQLAQKGGRAYAEILDRAGTTCLDTADEIDRFKLGQAARADRAMARDLRAIIASAVKMELQERIEGATGPLVFVGVHDPDAYATRDLADQVWALTTSWEMQVGNLVEEHGWSRERAERYVSSQRSVISEARPADLILRTDPERGALRDQVIRALSEFELRQPAPATHPAVSLPQTETPSASLPSVPEEGREPETKPSSPPWQANPSWPEAAPRIRPPSLEISQLRLIGRKILDALLVLLTIAFLTSWGLALAQYGRLHLPVQPLSAAWQAVIAVAQHIFWHPQSYYWAHEQTPWMQLVTETLGRSAGLLLLSMAAALLLGLPLGIAAARTRYKTASALTVVISILGASIPSFIFGMMLWVVNIWVHRSTGLQVLPATGFGWDAHVIMPTLVLAMRPLAQVAQITYVSVREVLGQDYVRTAHSKGLGWSAVLNRHVLRNVLIPILNTLGSSLRFSLSSLPVVEVFFNWPGVGSTLLSAIEQGADPLVMDLTLSLGMFFLLVNLTLEFFFPLIDPRLRAAAAAESQEPPQTLMAWLKGLGDAIAVWIADLRDARRAANKSLPPLIVPAANASLARPDKRTASRARLLVGRFLRNPVLIAASLMVLILIALAAFGEGLQSTNAYRVHGVMAINGKYSAPPFEPSSLFPWGTDQLGRDVQALIVAGARRTLSLAFFGMLARLLVGGTLGLLAGWRRGGWFDRLVSGAVGIWAAFPATIFAMLVIQALGIQQGFWVFVVAISLVGWGEVAQFVRGQVIALQAQPFIESARSVGARVDQILTRHIFPNLVNPLVVLGALEMGGILMLLAELGYLNIFLGGGFRVMTGETGAMAAIITNYSDVPEWSALIASIRDQWRSHAWMALYPGMAVFLAILTFNLFGEGLRRYLEEGAVSLSRLFNRRSLVAAAGLGVILSLVLGSSSPLSTYTGEALGFEESRVLEDIRVLSSPELQGRETGTPGADLAALYIAQRMAQIGIFPAGEHNSYFQRLLQPRLHLYETPTLTVLDSAGNAIKEFAYRQEFSELASLVESHGQAEGQVMGVAYGPRLESEANSQFGLGNGAAVDHVIIIRAADLAKVTTRSIKAVLVVADNVESLLRRDVLPYQRSQTPCPFLLISPQVADLLLRSAGSSLENLDAARKTLEPGRIQLTGEGLPVSVSLPARESDDPMNEAYQNVIGVIPGQGHFVGLEDQVIIVSAYYDGVGMDPQGTVFPGANDNASGIAMLLELARLLKATPFQPEKTVLFVAWAGGERQEGLNTDEILNARPGANQMTVEAVIELSGVGAGTGSGVAIGSDSSYRLVQLFQKAAARYSVATTTRGRGPHYGLPAPNFLGGREALTLSLSWDGSDRGAHLPQDGFAGIDPSKLRATGLSAYLTLLTLSRETEY